MDFKQLLAYQKGFNLAMTIFNLSKDFPKEEKYALTDQVRRSSRSVCANIAEAYRKRRYPRHFVSKLTDADAENSETSTWIDFAFESKYLSLHKKNELNEEVIQIGKLINYMINNPKKFGVNEH